MFPILLWRLKKCKVSMARERTPERPYTFSTVKGTLS
jgi:hypothetical protein